MKAAAFHRGELQRAQALNADGFIRYRGGSRTAQPAARLITNSVFQSHDSPTIRWLHQPPGNTAQAEAARGDQQAITQKAVERRGGDRVKFVHLCAVTENGADLPAFTSGSNSNR
jgi:hypothetical protein